MSRDPVDNNNPSQNLPFAVILEQRLSRRSVLRGAGLIGATTLPGFGLVACGGSSSGGLRGAIRLTFGAVAKNTDNNVSIPAGYSARVLYAVGDPINEIVSEYANDGTDGDFDQRAGDEHDGMFYFGLSDDGLPDPGRNDRALLVMNHENLEDTELHADGPTAAADNGGARPQAEVDKEMNAHGVSVIEIVDGGNGFQVNRASTFNRRITLFTEMDIRGPLRGNAALTTAFGQSGTVARGTVNNCANGYTPWGTYLTCEENWFTYFTRGDDEDEREDKENTLFARYGLGANSAGDSYREWNTVSGGVYERFDITAAPSGFLNPSSPDEDYRNEPNSFGYIVEIDPFDPASRPQKRTALGRFGHEGCWIGPVTAGEPLVFYMGDDSRNEYIYKFVSDAVWDPADATVADRLATGAKYMDAGTLYVARFDADGTGVWLPLSFGDAPLTSGNGSYSFADQADVVLATRLAADALGGTPMDRPEWGAVDPLTGEVYMTLTNSSSSSSGRGQGGGGSQPVDAANPRSYVDVDGNEGQGNVNGHIIRWHEDAGNASTSFTWDIFLFGAEADADPATINLSGLTADNDFSSPDGLWFDNRGLLWIQTDDGAYNDVTNDQLLAAVPGAVGDGHAVDVTSPLSGETVTTYVGRSASTDNLRRFLVGPRGCEITGIASNPANTALFVNVQHPSSPTLDGGDSWPNTSGDATALGNGARGRSATIVITRNDGGEIGIG